MLTCQKKGNLKGGITGLLHNHWFLIEEGGCSSPMEGFTKFYSNSVGEIKEFIAIQLLTGTLQWLAKHPRWPMRVLGKSLECPCVATTLARCKNPKQFKQDWLSASKGLLSVHFVGFGLQGAISHFPLSHQNPTQNRLRVSLLVPVVVKTASTTGYFLAYTFTLH